MRLSASRQSDQSTGGLIPSLILSFIHCLHGRDDSIHAEVTRRCERLLAQKAAVVGFWKTREV